MWSYKYQEAVEYLETLRHHELIEILHSGHCPPSKPLKVCFRQEAQSASRLLSKNQLSIKMKLEYMIEYIKGIRIQLDTSGQLICFAIKKTRK